jgi:hypothetical protein
MRPDRQDDGSSGPDDKNERPDHPTVLWKLDLDPDPTAMKRAQVPVTSPPNEPN